MSKKTGNNEGIESVFAISENNDELYSMLSDELVIELVRKREEILLLQVAFERERFEMLEEIESIFKKHDKDEHIDNWYISNKELHNGRTFDKIPF